MLVLKMDLKDVVMGGTKLSADINRKLLYFLKVRYERAVQSELL